MRKVTREMIEELMVDATRLAIGARIGRKTAVRRILGAAGWQHDPERIAAAQAKRERRRQRANGASA